MLEEISKELERGIVKVVQFSEVKMLLDVFLIPKKNKEWRKILDCTPLNRFMRDIHFKMEDHRTLAHLLRRDMWAVSLDIKSAFHHITVDPELTPFLSFEYDQKYYQYLGMPFGIKMAPRVFTRIMHRCMVVVRERWQVEVVQYIDDLWFGHMDHIYLGRTVVEVMEFLRQLGWLINLEKSELIPKKIFQFLGWTWDTLQMTVALELKKAKQIRQSVIQWIGFTQKNLLVPVRRLASLIGALSATRLQFQEASLYLSELNHLKTLAVKNTSWNGHVCASSVMLKDLMWWKETLKQNKPRSLVVASIQAEMWTDASPTGWGAHISWEKDKVRPKLMTFGFWNDK
jgi:hypothetical protein